jgi:uncharacterized repeat protein (TIGR03803 family)
MTYERKRICRILSLMLAAAMASPAQDEQVSPDAVTFKTLFSFDGTNGFAPSLNLVQGLDGNLYGTTFYGGTGNVSLCNGLDGCGTVFKLSPSGTETTLHNFCSQPNCTDGGIPNEFGALTLGTDGYLYGVTQWAGNFLPSGTIFKIAPSGALTTLYSIGSGQGFPYSAVVRGADGNFYGVMPDGGNSNQSLCGDSPNQTCGAAYRITPAGVFSIIYNFCSQANCADGAVPFAQLISGSDGNLYGTTEGGGANLSGTVFKLSLAGKLTTLYSFNATDCGNGLGLCAPLVQANNGNLYGTTYYGGPNASPMGGTAGTFFEITPAGTFSTLYNFCSQANCADGGNPVGFVQGTDGNFYGVTQAGGSSSNNGTVFKITAKATLTTLHSFSGTDGSFATGLVQATNGTFYGETAGGGNSACPYIGCGTLFSLSVALGPFVETLPSAGKAGAHVEILGSDLTGATSVTFSGTAATFRVVSATEIKTTVPTGATTGEVEVVTPTGTVKSNVRFHVRP